MITSYTNLQTAVADWLNRQDLTAQIPTFIQLGERMLARTVVTEDEVSGTLVLTGSEVNLPAECEHLRSLSVSANGYPREVPVGTLQEVMAARGPQGGVPEVYAVVNGVLWLGPAPDTQYSAIIVYRRTLDLAAESSGSNWLLTKAPDAYLYAALLQASPYLGEDGRVALWATALDKVLGDLKRDRDLAAHSGTITRVPSRAFGG